MVIISEKRSRLYEGMPFRQAENLPSGSGSVCDRGSGSFSAEEAVALKEKITDKLQIS